MPAKDEQHDLVIRCLAKAGWTVVKEQVSLAVGDHPENLRRLYIDLAVQSQQAQIILIEIKALEPSPVHQFMLLVGQYLVYRTALDHLNDNTLLYVALSEADYTNMFEHPLTQRVVNETLRQPIPIVIYDPIQEVILRWIPTP